MIPWPVFPHQPLLRPGHAFLKLFLVNAVILPLFISHSHALLPPPHTNAGYLQPGDGVACVDIDECAAGTAACDPRATCTNLLGSYNCSACPLGWRGVGRIPPGASAGCSEVTRCRVNNGGCDRLVRRSRPPPAAARASARASARARLSTH